MILEEKNQKNNRQTQTSAIFDHTYTVMKEIGDYHFFIS
jgi:hypothetical protein